MEFSPAAHFHPPGGRGSHLFQVFVPVPRGFSLASRKTHRPRPGSGRGSRGAPGASREHFRTAGGRRTAPDREPAPETAGPAVHSKCTTENHPATTVTKSRSCLLGTRIFGHRCHTLWQIAFRLVRHVLKRAGSPVFASGTASFRCRGRKRPP